MDKCGNIPKISHLGLDPELPMAINCEWGAFDSTGTCLPRTPYDVVIDKNSPRPGQQAFEKMVAGLYLGEIFRLTLLDLHGNPDCRLFAKQDVSKLEKPYTLDSGFLAQIEEFVYLVPLLICGNANVQPEIRSRTSMKLTNSFKSHSAFKLKSQN